VVNYLVEGMKTVTIPFTQITVILLCESSDLLCYNPKQTLNDYLKFSTHLNKINK